MPTSSSALQDVTTINYTLEWPHLENPSNSTFVGSTQIDICRCGPNNTDLGHVYTRHRCPHPEVRFATSNDELWVLQAPLWHVNLLRPATTEEAQRREEVDEDAAPSAYAGKNFLLLTGPCPRGRYQAYATLQFLKTISPRARQNVEYLSILIQPYEEDCSDDQGGRAYVELARFILEELSAFRKLYLHVWGEETRAGSREFAMVLWKEGVRIVVSWDWSNGETEEYEDVDEFLRAVDEGVVIRGNDWVDEGSDGGVALADTETAGTTSNDTRPISRLLGRRRDADVVCQEVSRNDDEGDGLDTEENMDIGRDNGVQLKVRDYEHDEDSDPLLEQ